MKTHTVCISYDALTAFCVQGARITLPDGETIECAVGLPPDAQIVNATPNVTANAVTLTLIDSSDAVQPTPVWVKVKP
jgi:hypothetical protein